MSKSLVITEKPSVAVDIASALGGFTEHDGYSESDDYVVTFAVGHFPGEGSYFMRSGGFHI